MGWDSRRYEGGAKSRGRFRAPGGGGGARAVLRRIFGDGENPFDWALPLYTAWGIRVRLSIWYILWMIAELLLAIPKDTMGWTFRAVALGTLFLLVLLHEYGHCIACRRIGGTADQILMWPLGGLAYCAPPHHWKADLISTLGGPMVNVLLVPVLGGALLALGQHTDVLVFNPFQPKVVMPMHPIWLTAIWWAYYLNLLLLAFNMLLPMYPMDCGRVLQAILWRSFGYRQSLDLATKVGMVTAIGLIVFAATWNQSVLLMVAFFGLSSCYFERRRLKLMSSDPALAGYDFEGGYTTLPPDEDDEDDRATRLREKRRKQEQEDQAELDRILAKIAATGMASLTRAERRWLERATERRRQG